MQQFRLAICDDEEYFIEDIRQYLKAYISETENEMLVDAYHSGNELLEVLEQVEKSYDIYLLDVDMPQMRGTDLAKELRQRYPMAVICFVTAKVATKNLVVNEDYLIMKPGQSFSLKAKVTPEEASQAVTYQSSDMEIATVSADGVVTAKKCGSTSVIVSNGDANISVSVIVNETGEETKNADETDNVEKSEKSTIRRK